MVEKKFEKLQKLYSLPVWKELDHEFEVHTIENDNFLLREIIKKMDDRLDSFTQLIENILSPDAGSLSDICEVRCFSESDKTKFFELFKKLKFFRLLFYETNLTRDEKKEAHAINDFFGAWVDLKKELIPIVSELQSCWIKESEPEELNEYFG